MTLRTDGQSVRLRLSDDDIDQLVREGRVDEAVTFGPLAGQQLRFALVVSDAAADLGLEYDAGDLRVIIPRAWAEGWPGSDRVGFDREISGGVSLLVEKDKGCRHRV